MKAQYFQAIEQAFLEASGRGLAISERDRVHIENWFDAGVPMSLVQEVLSDLGKNENNAKMRTLSYASKAVGQAFVAWRQKQTGRAELNRDKAPVPECPFKIWVEQLKSRAQHRLSNDLTSNEWVSFIEKVQGIDLDDPSQLIGDFENLVYEAFWSVISFERQRLIEHELNSRMADQLFLTAEEKHISYQFLRNKIIRQAFMLPEFDRQMDVGW